MATHAPWRTQLSTGESTTHSVQHTPRPRPPAFALRSRRPSNRQPAEKESLEVVENTKPPPPYRKELDDDVLIAARALGLEVGDAQMGAVNEMRDVSPEGPRESTEEMKKRLKAMEKLLSEREKELSLAAQIGQSLLTTNISLRTQHESLLSNLPSNVSNTTDRLSGQASTVFQLPSAPNENDLPEGLGRSLSQLEVDRALDMEQRSPPPLSHPLRGPARPPLHQFASSSTSTSTISSQTHSQSYARLQLQDLSEQNHILTCKLSEIEEEEEQRRKKMRKLEGEIARLRTELEKAEERRENDSASIPLASAMPAKPSVVQQWRRRTTTADLTTRTDAASPSSEGAATSWSGASYPEFPNGTPEPLPILRRTKRRERNFDDKPSPALVERLADEKSKADLADAKYVLTRAALTRAPLSHQWATPATTSSPLNPVNMSRGSGNRQMIESNRKSRRNVASSDLKSPSRVERDHAVTAYVSRRGISSLSVSTAGASSLRLTAPRTPQTQRQASTSPSGGSPSFNAKVASIGSPLARTLDSELGDEWDLAISELVGANDCVTSNMPVATSIALSALVLALSPSSSMTTDSSTPILPAGAFKNEEELDSRSFDLLDQAVCERSLRWADDEKEAEDELDDLNSSDMGEIESEAGSWALTRFKRLDKRSVRPPRPSRHRSTPSLSFGAPAAMLIWGQPADPWEATRYPEDDEAFASSPRRRETSPRRKRTSSYSWRATVPTSLSVGVKQSSSPVQEGQEVTQFKKHRSLPDRVVRTAIKVLMDVWVFMQFIVVVGVFLWVTVRKGPRAILGATRAEKRIS